MSSGEDRYPRPNPPKPRPKPKPKPRPKPASRPKPRAVMPGDPGFGTGTDARARARRGTPGSTSAKVKKSRSKPGQVVQPKYKSQPKPDAGFAAWAADVEKTKRGDVLAAVRKSAPSRDEKIAGLTYGGSGWADVVGNFGGDVTDVITGIPSLAQLGAKNVASFSPFSPAPYARAASELGLPGGSWAKGLQESTIKDDVTSGKAMAADYNERWVKPLKAAAHGDFGPLGHQLFEHPGLGAADIATAWSGVGAGVRGTLSLGGKIAAGTRIGERMAYHGSKAYGPGTARARTPRRLERGINADGREIAVATTLKGGPTPRPFSANPPTRFIQRAVGRILDKRAEVSAAAERTSMRGKRHTARTEMIERRMSRDQRMAADKHVEGVVERRARPFLQAMEDLTKAGKWTADEADMAAYLHSTGQLDIPGKTPVEAASDVAGTWERNASKAKARGERVDNRIKNPETIRAIIEKHPELLYPVSPTPKGVIPRHLRMPQMRGGAPAPTEFKGPVPEMAEAVEQYRALATEATEARIEAGTLNADTARARAQAPAREMHLAPTTEVHPEVARGRAALMTDASRKLKIQELERERSQIVQSYEVVGNPIRNHQRTRVAQINRELSHLDDPRPIVVDSPRNPYSPVGKKAVYVKDEVVDLPATGRGGNPSGAMGRRTLERDKQRTGSALASGNVRVDRGLPIRSFQRAVVHGIHPTVWRDLIDTIGFRNPRNGKLAAGERARMAFQADPEGVTLISTKSMRDARRALDEMPEGVMPDSPFDGVKLFEGQDSIAEVSALPREALKEYVAVPTAAIKGMREGWSGMIGKQTKWFDTPQSLWKRGILALSPRWYFNSLIGNTMMYGLATGGDFRSMARVMRSQALEDAIPGRIRGSTVVEETRATERVAGNRASERFRKITDPLIGAQSAFDALYRKALYVRRVKQGLKAEGTKTRGLSPEAFAEAVRTAPKHVIDQAMRETELFMGDYMRLSPFERTALRRVFPFYSWLRVINRFMLEVPVRHPKRVGVTAALARAATESQNPEDWQQPILANRGRIIGKLPGVGNVAMRTASANPFFTGADMVKSVADFDPQGVAGGIVSNLSPIGLQQAARFYSGRTAFGAPVSAPPGKGGLASKFGGASTVISRVTNLPDYREASYPIESSLWDAFPVPQIPQILKATLAGDRQVYDTTTISQLLDRAVRGSTPERDAELFQPRRDRAMTPFPGAIGASLSLSGLPIQRYDKGAERAAYKKMIANRREGEQQTRRRKAGARAKG